MTRIAGLFLIVISSCGNGTLQEQPISKVVSPKELQALILEKEGLQLIDVRTANEYKAGHLSKAMLIDYYQPDFKDRLLKLEKDKPIAVYCTIGGRSNSALKILKELGFKEVYDLKGGIKAWQREKLPVDR